MLVTYEGEYMWKKEEKTHKLETYEVGFRKHLGGAYAWIWIPSSVLSRI